MEYLFTYLSPECIGMPNTNNMIEGLFSALKKRLNVHSRNSSRVFLTRLLPSSAAICFNLQKSKLNFLFGNTKKQDYFQPAK